MAASKSTPPPLPGKLTGPAASPPVPAKPRKIRAGMGDVEAPAVEVWTDDDYRNWRKRIHRPAALNAGLKAGRPYDLRHSFVSLLIHEGVSIVEVARQAGHSPEECLRTYAHTFEEFDPAERTPAATVITHARGRRLGSNVRVLYAREAGAKNQERTNRSTEPSRRRDSNPRPPLYESGALAN